MGSHRRLCSRFRHRRYVGDMNAFLDRLSSARRFGMNPSLDAVKKSLASLGDPQKKLKAVHIAGTNGKGALASTIDCVLRAVSKDKIARYTSPHLVNVNERFFIDGEIVRDDDLRRAFDALKASGSDAELTYFEILTAAAFWLFADKGVDVAVLECGLGGRFDATNVCEPSVSVITNVGLDHCAWLGDSVEKIAAEKAGIIKPGVPVVLGRNSPEVVTIVSEKAKDLGSRFYYSPDVVFDEEIPERLALKGEFNRENARTALAVLKVLGVDISSNETREAFSQVVWPGRFHEIKSFIVDGAHNPPAAQALVEALNGEKVNLIAGFCADKNVREVLRILSANVLKAYAVATANERSLTAGECALEMRLSNIDATECSSLDEAIKLCQEDYRKSARRTLIAGSLFLAGEALVKLNAYPWRLSREFDAAELLTSKKGV